MKNNANQTWMVSGATLALGIAGAIYWFGLRSEATAQVSAGTVADRPPRAVDAEGYHYKRPVKAISNPGEVALPGVPRAFDDESPDRPLKRRQDTKVKAKTYAPPA